MMCAWSVTMKTRSPATATPRFALPPLTPLVRGRLKCQIRRPLPASSAKHSFGAVTYMMPSTTTGVPCSPPGVGHGEHPARREPRRRCSCRSASASCSDCRRSRRCRSASSVSDVTARYLSPARRSRWTRLSSVRTCTSSKPSLRIWPSNERPSVVCEAPCGRSAPARYAARSCAGYLTRSAISDSEMPTVGGIPLVGLPSRIVLISC